MAAIASNTEQRFGSPTAEAIWKSDTSNLSKGLQPQIDRNARIRARQNRMSMPVAPANLDITQAPSLPDRRKSTRPRPISVRVDSDPAAAVSSRGLARTPSIRSAKRQSFGPVLPLIVDGINPLASPRTEVHSPMSMAETPTEKKVTDDEDSFEDAPETSSNRTTALDLLEGNRSSASAQPTLNGDRTIIEETNDTTPQLTRSRQGTSKKVPNVREQQPNGSIPESIPALAVDETSPAVLASEQAAAPDASLLKRMSFEPGSQDAIQTVPSVEVGTTETNTQRMSAQLSPELKPVDDRARSISPTRSPEPPKSPPKPARVLSTDSTGSDIRASATSPPPGPGGLARTASTRIAGFFRGVNVRKTSAKSPVPQIPEKFVNERSQSIASVNSNGTEGLPAIDDAVENGHHAKRPSLQHQFENLRRQAERNVSNGSIPAEHEEQSRVVVERTASDAGLASPTSSFQSPDSKSRSASTPGPINSPRLDPTLPPGTVAGLAAGPSEDSRPVDWDLWQAVITEGPSAVAKTSGEELTRAIASGIPAAIRGVIWQVLADSKNPELEDLYRTLKAKTAADADLQPPLRPPPASREASQTNLTATVEKLEKESDVASSRSSVHSEQSTAPTSVVASQISPPQSVQGDEAELKANILAEKARKEEAAALTKLEKAIKRDLGSRTSFSKYAQAAGLQDGLFGVCKAYALFDEGVGYAQGMNFIAMPLLFNMTEEEAFTLLARLMSKYDIRSMFTGDLSGLHLRLYQFERLLEDHDPALYCHLRRRNVGPQLYATQWFLTLFAYRFPLQLVLRVYDLLFSQGLTAILRFGLVLMQKNRQTLLEMKDMGHLTDFLKEKVFDVYIDKAPSASSLLDSGFFGSVSGGADKDLYRADEMVRDACNVEVSDATLAAYTAEFEENQRLTLDKANQFDTLRTTNATLSARVKVLEERTQQQDQEHVSITGDFVRNKVDNDRLQDENEGLRMKVEELQKLVDSQPAEIETKFKEEMERIMQRNSEVQSENRLLKEEQEEMEQQMVQIKMKHAETQGDYDALTQKWSNLQAMLADK